MIKTHDPETFIEYQEGNVTIYYRPSDGLRWKVTGSCDFRGHCMVGAVIDGTVIESVEHLNTLAQGKRIESELDVPIGPKFEGCCPFEIEVL